MVRNFCTLYGVKLSTMERMEREALFGCWLTVISLFNLSPVWCEEVTWGFVLIRMAISGKSTPMLEANGDGAGQRQMAG
jgi:hypothetical protein